MIRRGGVAVVAAGTAAVTVAAFRRDVCGPRWSRRNFRDRQVHLGAGPAATLGVLAGACAAGVPSSACAAVAIAGGLGLYDDLVGGTHARGLRGHGRALARGEVTTGLVKMLGLVAAGVVAAPPRSGRGRGVSRLTDAALIAGAANLLNLLDLRPGRALKAVAVAAAPLTAAGEGSAEGMATALLATVSALLRGDLGEQHMLGDCGANALGAAAGWAVADYCGPACRTAALAVVVGLTLVSERKSFSVVIDNQPLLSALDNLGRRPA